MTLQVTAEKQIPQTQFPECSSKIDICTKQAQGGHGGMYSKSVSCFLSTFST
jgi:hypothetical protein